LEIGYQVKFIIYLFKIIIIFNFKKKATPKQTKSGSKSIPISKPIQSHTHLNWLSGLDDKTRLTFLNRVINKDCTLGQVKQVVKKHKVFEFMINKHNLFNFKKEMLWAQQVFINDTKKEDWNDAIREFGPGVESALRTFASTLKVVKTSELKNVNYRPVNYLSWLKKITGKV